MAIGDTHKNRLYDDGWTENNPKVTQDVCRNTIGTYYIVQCTHTTNSKMCICVFCSILHNIILATDNIYELVRHLNSIINNTFVHITFFLYMTCFILKFKGCKIKCIRFCLPLVSTLRVTLRARYYMILRHNLYNTQTQHLRWINVARMNDKLL